MTQAVLVRSCSPVAGQMRRSDRRRHRAKLCPEFRPRAILAVQFVRGRKFRPCQQRCQFPAQADTPAQSARVIAPVKTGLKGKMNGRSSAGELSASESARLRNAFLAKIHRPAFLTSIRLGAELPRPIWLAKSI